MSIVVRPGCHAKLATTDRIIIGGPKLLSTFRVGEAVEMGSLWVSKTPPVTRMLSQEDHSNGMDTMILFDTESGEEYYLIIEPRFIEYEGD